MKTSRSDVRRMMSDAVKQSGPRAVWLGLRPACMQKYWPRLIRKYVFGNTTQLTINMGGRLV